MLNSAQNALLKSLTTALKPLVRVLLRFGIDYGTVSEILRGVYVDVASDDAQKAGARPTVSGIAACTGLTRKEVKRLKELPKIESGQTHERYNRAIRVISGWINDADFLDEQSNPALLPLESNDGRSFADLVKRYSGDIPHAAMLSVLKASGIVALDDRQVTLLGRAYVPTNDPKDTIDILGVDTAELITTIAHNISVPKEQRVYQRKVSNALVRSDALAEFKKISFKRSQELLEELDSYLAAHEVDQTDQTASASYVALGIYYFDSSLEEETRSGVKNED